MAPSRRTVVKSGPPLGLHSLTIDVPGDSIESISPPSRALRGNKHVGGTSTQMQDRELVQPSSNRVVLHICTRDTIRPLRDRVLRLKGFEVDSATHLQRRPLHVLGPRLRSRADRRRRRAAASRVPSTSARRSSRLSPNSSSPSSATGASPASPTAPTRSSAPSLTPQPSPTV